MSQIAVFAVGRRGVRLALQLRQHLGARLYATRRVAPEGAEVIPERGAAAAVAGAFATCTGLVLIMPVGAAVRLVAPLLRDKRRDPAVVALDEGGRHVVALLSSHEGGGNELARSVGAVTGATPIITTTDTVTGGLALDLLVQQQGWTVDPETVHHLARVNGALLDGDPVACFQDAGSEDWWSQAPGNLTRVSAPEAIGQTCAGALVITDRAVGVGGSGIPTVVFRPPALWVGVGCVRGASAAEIGELVDRALRGGGWAPGSVAGFATIDLKRDEAGIGEFALARGRPVRYFPAAELAAAGAPSGPAAAVAAAVGTPAVAEPAALLAAAGGALVVPKIKTGRVTVAVARVAAPGRRGSLHLVGTGPGDLLDLTPRARAAITGAGAVVGYRLYVDQVRPLLHGGQQVHPSALGSELDRCRLAIDLALRGERVALLSSGDAGIYGMAGPALELVAAAGGAIDVVVVPGVSAAQAAAALLGAPLMTDFATISLSDLLIPWAAICARLEHLAAADIALAIYNPRSARRDWQLRRAQEVLLAHRPPATPVGIVRNATRPGQTTVITTLDHLLDHPVDMLTVVVVGSSQTVVMGGRMVTHRGYNTAES